MEEDEDEEAEEEADEADEAEADEAEAGCWLLMYGLILSILFFHTS